MDPVDPIIPPGAIVVVDIDDTLYLERCYVRSGFDAVGRLLATEHGLDGAGDRLWADFQAGVRGDAFDRLLAGYGLDPDPGLVKALVDCYRHHRPDITLLTDARDLLTRLDGRAMAAITDGPAPSQRAKADALDLDRWLQRVVFTAELGAGFGKPHEQAYALLEAFFAVPAQACWYIADNPAKDFVAPLRRGWSSVRVRRPGSLHEAVPTPSGVAEVVSLDQIGT